MMSDEGIKSQEIKSDIQKWQKEERWSHREIGIMPQVCGKTLGTAAGAAG